MVSRYKSGESRVPTTDHPDVGRSILVGIKLDKCPLGANVSYMSILAPDVIHIAAVTRLDKM